MTVSVAPLRTAPGDPAYAALAERFGAKLSLTEAVRGQHAGIAGPHAVAIPDAVLYAAAASDVVSALRACSELGIPVIPHGAGSSLEGHLAAAGGGLSLDLTGLDRIIEISSDDLLARVEAGVTREKLNHELRHRGLFFPLDPGANATLGGMAATRASGTNAVRYGTMRHNVLSLEVVLPDGTLIETGTRAAKSSAGYDLTGLFVGSEGTLGVITAVTVRLHGIPETIVAATCRFDALDGCVAAVIEACQAGLPVARIELLDSAQIAACNAYSHLTLPVGPTLFLEFHGSASRVADDVHQFAELASMHGGGTMDIAARAEDRSRLWKARHDAYFAAQALQPGGIVWPSDVCVPIGALAESIRATHADLEATGVQGTIVGHVGDGNYHVLFVFDPEDAAARERAEAVNRRMVNHAIAVGGTCTGEHGIGIGKQDHLIHERGQAGVSLMRSIKRAIDPAWIMNPGKVFAADAMTALPHHDQGRR